MEFYQPVSDIQGRSCSSPTIVSWNPYLLLWPIPVGVVCMGGPSSTAVALPDRWWCVCELCHIRSVSIHYRLFQIQLDAVLAVSWSFLMAVCLMGSATQLDYIQELQCGPVTKTSPANLHWIHMVIPTIVLVLVLQGGISKMHMSS